ncbi:hypothetical protein [Algiphilus sp.]|uniref:hypothetical protein n=1 Tax=Algiphilus sp. TaxID=1872431 RepID=UPI003B522116
MDIKASTASAAETTARVTRRMSVTKGNATGYQQFSSHRAITIDQAAHWVDKQCQRTPQRLKVDESGIAPDQCVSVQDG